MINIIVDKDDDVITIEGKEFTPIWNHGDSWEKLIKFILDKAYYGGEKLCLEVKKDGNYTELERW